MADSTQASGASSAPTSSSSSSSSSNGTPLSSPLASNPKLDRFRTERDSLLASSSYYELLQHYKASIYRANTKKDYATAALLALDGATALLQHGQATSAGELALALVTTYTKQALIPTPAVLSSLLSLFWSFPPDAAASRVAVMKAAIKWSVGERVRRHGHADLHLSFARWYVAGEADRGSEEKDYASSHTHYLMAAGASAVNARQFGAHVPLTFSPPPPAPASSSSAEHDTYSEHASLLLTWASHGYYPSELPLFITRTVLQYLALADLKGAHATLDYIMTRLLPPQSSTVPTHPLLHFVQFLLRLCERGGDAGELYDVLRSKYAPVLGGSDEGLESYLDKVGEVFFGREAKKNLLDSLLS